MNIISPMQIAPDRLMGFTFGFAPPVIIEAGLRLGIFDLLDVRANTIDEIAAVSGASIRGLRIILNALVGLDLLKESKRDLFADAGKCQISRFQQTDVPRCFLPADERTNAVGVGQALFNRAEWPAIASRQ